VSVQPMTQRVSNDGTLQTERHIWTITSLIRKSVLKIFIIFKSNINTFTEFIVIIKDDGYIEGYSQDQ